MNVEKLWYHAPPHSSRRWLLPIVVGCAIAIVAWAGMRWWPPLSAKWRHYSWERACLYHSLPPDTVVHEEDPQRAQLLQHSSQFLYEPIYMNRPLPVGYVCPEWTSYSSTVHASPSLLFAHGRCAPGGHEQLVAVTALFDSGLIIYSVIDPGGLFGEPRRIDDSRTPLYPVVNRGPGQVVRVFAGRIDPVDPARFLIPYELNDETGEIEGILRTDGTVSLRVISGPCMMPAGYEQHMQELIKNLDPLPKRPDLR